jgi:uncharacterized protein
MSTRPVPLTVVIGFVGFFTGAGAWAVQPQDLQDPRPGAEVLDEPKLLPGDSFQALQRICTQARAQTGSELMVVIVGTIGGAEPQAFASALFDRWGIGGADKRSGLLLFVALEDHAVVGMLGKGIDNDERARIGDEILQDEIIGRFKAGDPVQAILQGALAYARRVLGAKPLGPATPPVEKASPAPSPRKPQPRPRAKAG